MAQVSVTFPVTLLVETDSPGAAGLFAGMWSVSMIQATHGVKLQTVPAEIRAVSFDLGKVESKDVTTDFGSYVDRIRKEGGPDALDWARAFGNFNVGMQPYWEQYEFDRRLESKGIVSSETSRRIRYFCTYCGAWREADPARLIASLVEGQEPGSDEDKAISEARKIEGPFMAKHLAECGPKGGIVSGVYPDDPQWDKLDPNKREY